MTHTRRPGERLPGQRRLNRRRLRFARAAPALGGMSRDYWIKKLLAAAVAVTTRARTVR
jgi:hypothetical protein